METTSRTPHTPRSLRAALDMTQEALAERAGTSARTIGLLESGEDVALDSLRKIAGALGVDVAVLIVAHDVERAKRVGAN